MAINLLKRPQESRDPAQWGQKSPPSPDREPLVALTLDGKRVTPRWIGKHTTTLTARYLQKISLVFCQIGDPSTRMLLPLLAQGNVRHVNLSNNQIGPDGASALAEFICERPTEVIVSDNPINAGFSKLALAMFRHRRHVALNNTFDRPEEIASLADLVQKCGHEEFGLVSLNLAHNPIGEAYGGPLSQVLSHMPHLRRLFLGHTELGDKASFAISEPLKRCTIDHLELQGNQISDLGAHHFVLLLAKYHMMQIVIWGNPINVQAGEIGALMMMRTWKVNFKRCAINAIGIQTLCRLVQTRPFTAYQCKLLNLSQNPLTDGSELNLIETLKHVQRLQVKLVATRLNASIPPIIHQVAPYQHIVNLKCNSMGDQSLETLFDTMRNQPCRIKVLDLSDNQLTLRSIIHLAKFLFCKRSIKKIDITGNDFQTPIGQGRDLKSDFIPFVREMALRTDTIDLSGTQIYPRALARLGEAIKATGVEIHTIYVDEIPVRVSGKPLSAYFPHYTQITIANEQSPFLAT
ncbi:MAG: hypothetical protein S4CHLAM102_13960 [Chlamydiia bacterium]|nr:hypothetical protein [Chlamydiia bacterium]